MRLWKKILVGIALTAFAVSGTTYWRVSRSGSELVSADTKIKLVEKPCDKALLPGRCGVVIAPLDYDNPRGKTVEVGFVIYPAIGFTNRVLQLVGGGPGTPITSTLKSGGGAAILPIRAMLYSRSLLFVEPRGLALSTQVHCGEEKTPAIFMSDDPSIKQRCADEIGPDADHYTTENIARDFNRVRQALGISELDVYGFSYGTNLSSVYASLYPKHIRTLGLDGAIPLKTWDMYMPTHYSAMKRQMKQFCERSAQCKTDEVMQAMSWATAELRKAPRSLQAYVKSDYMYKEPMQLDVATLAGMAASSPMPDMDPKTGAITWRLPFISALLKAYKQKDWTALDAVTVEGMGFKKSDFALVAASGNSYPVNMIILCQDWTVPWKRTSTYDQRVIQYQANATAFEKARPNAFAPFTAEEWGMRRGGGAYYRGNIGCPVQKTPLPAQSEKTYSLPQTLPVLVVNAEYDFQTVMEDAELAAAQFKNAQFARYKNHGHAVLPESMCAMSMLREFVANKRVADPKRCYNDVEASVSIEKSKNKAN
jgi:pimeloyl-ACP methyl ester carboxylesterase